MKNKRTFKNHRKGVIDNTVLAILAVATILVFSIFVYKAYIGFKEKMTIQSCKNTIEAHTAVATLSARDIFTDIKCPTSEITIKDQRKAKEILAEDMHRCWYIWGQGKGQYFQGEGSFCHICAIYQFGDKGQEIDGFMSYLETEPIKVKYTGDVQGTTYKEYFTGVATPKSQQMIGRSVDELSKVDYIDTSQKYATIFVYASGQKPVQLALEGGGRSKLGTVGTFGVLGGTAAGVGGATAAIALASNPLGWIIGGVAVTGLGVAAIWQSLHVVEPESIQFIVFRPYDLTEIQNMSCDKLYVNQMSNIGKIQ